MCDRITTLETHLRILKTMAPYAAINFIRNGMGYEEYLQEYARYRKIKPEELMETLNRIHESARGMKTLEEWMAYMDEYTRKLEEQAKKQDVKREGVVISTLHAVKGLEYDNVYIMNVNEGSMPYRKAVLEAHLEEERRLFYVGMTRAKKKKLCLYYVRQQYEKKREPSRFLKEAGVVAQQCAQIRTVSDAHPKVPVAKAVNQRHDHTVGLGNPQGDAQGLRIMVDPRGDRMPYRRADRRQHGGQVQRPAAYGVAPPVAIPNGRYRLQQFVHARDFSVHVFHSSTVRRKGHGWAGFLA